jgi:hypothetical protein
MQIHNENPDDPCLWFHSYLDGDLSLPEAAEFDAHLTGCGPCSEALTLHQQLEREFETLPPAEIELPKDFSKVVAANAESQVRGLRKPSERRTSLVIVCGLAIVLFVFLGVNIQSVLRFVSFVAERIGAVLSVVFGFLFNLCLGVIVILRVAATQAGMPEFFFLTLVLVVVGFMAILALYRFGRTFMIREVKR